MKFDLRKPCAECPFRKGSPIRLTKARAVEIADNMISYSGGDFPCHKTTVPSDDGYDRQTTKDTQHCAGALIFAEKNGVANQMMRISERLGMYVRATVMGEPAVVAEVCDTRKELIQQLTRR